MKDEKYLRNLWRLVKAHRNYFVWAIIILIPLSLGLIFNSANTILVITALIVFFYTYETYKMRKAIADNTEISGQFWFYILKRKIEVKEPIFG